MATQTQIKNQNQTDFPQQDKALERDVSSSNLSKEAYETRIKAQLDKLNGQIQELQGKLRQTQVEATVEYDSLLQELLDRRDAVEIKFAEIHNTSNQAWQELTQGFETAWGDLNKAFEKAWGEFNQAFDKAR